MWETTRDGLFHLRKCYYGLWTRSNGLKLKMSYWWICFLQTCSFSFLKTLTDGVEWCGLLVDYCDVFISCLDSHSNGTHSLQCDAMLHFSKSDEETNSSTSRVAWGWAHSQQIFIFGWTIPIIVNTQYFRGIGIIYHNLVPAGWIKTCASIRLTQILGFQKRFSA